MTAADTAIILMAAGVGKRFGSNKLLAPYRGRPMWEYALDVALTAKSVRGTPVILVSGYQTLLDAPDVIPVRNDCPLLGASHTIRLGVKAAEQLGAEYAIFMVADQPELKAGSLLRLIEAREPGENCLPGQRRTGGKPGAVPPGILP